MQFRLSTLLIFMTAIAGLAVMIRGLGMMNDITYAAGWLLFEFPLLWLYTRLPAPKKEAKKKECRHTP